MVLSGCFSSYVHPYPLRIEIDAAALQLRLTRDLYYLREKPDSTELPHECIE